MFYADAVGCGFGQLLPLSTGKQRTFIAMFTADGVDDFAAKSHFRN
jgi:hypothetical protein